MKQTICMNQNIKKHIMKQNGIRWTLLLSLLAGCWSAWASPASPYPLRFLQPDGQVLTVCLRGDEHLHYYESPDGLMLCKNSQGYLCYATTAPEDGNRVVASTTIARQDPAGSISSQPFADARFQQRLRESFRTEHQRNERSKAAQTPGVVKKTFPTTGKCKGVIILAEFTDKKFAHEDCHDLFDRLANEKGYQGPHASGSIHDYFVEQSGGLFSPEFDVIGPVTLPHPMTREHHIRFIAYVTSDRTELVRLYPEGAAQARFLNRGRGKFFWCCNRHGLYTAHYGRKPKI